MSDNDVRLLRATRARRASGHAAGATREPGCWAGTAESGEAARELRPGAPSPSTYGAVRRRGLHALFGTLLPFALAACAGDGTPPADSDRSPSSGDDDGGTSDEGRGDSREVDGGSEDDDEPAVRDAGRGGSTSARDGAVQTAKSDAQAAKPDGSGASAPGKPDDAGADDSSGDAATVPSDGGDEGPAKACQPADMKPAPMNVPVSSIRRYQGQTVAAAKGPYKPVLETDPGLPEYTIYRPEKLGEIKHPVMVWANGGCSKDGTYFSKYLLEVASHGFVAISVGRPNGTGMGTLGPDGAPQIKALDWILAENERPCSQYYRKLDVTKSAAMGQSCGGLMTLGASKDKRLTTVGIFNSGLFDKDQAIYSGLHTPVGYFIGGADDIAYPQAESDVMMINSVPLFYGNLDVGHFATWAEDNAGEFGRVGIGWLKWHLMGDSAAEKMFKGKDCELCVSPSKWKITKKMME